MPDELVRMEHINKFFGRVQALNDVSLSVRPSEIVGLLGDNGAGKSTLIKILSGALRANSGDIYMRGNKVDIRNTTDAIAQGIETIYQDSALVTQLSIARNLFLGREPVKGPLNRLDQIAMNEVARDLLKRVGITKEIPPATPISALSGGERQAVAIARAMHFDSDLKASYASFAVPATPGIRVSLSRTIFTMSFRWLIALSCCGEAKRSRTTSILSRRRFKRWRAS